MNHHPLLARLGLVIVIGLLALPIANIGSPVEAKNRSRIVTRTFRNVVPITIPSGPALPSPVSAGYYPSDIRVAGLKGTIRDVNLTLTGFAHDDPQEIQVLLAGPGGQTAVVMANIGGGHAATGITLKLDDEAAAPLPDHTMPQSGTFRPTNVGGSAIAFNAPAPSGGAGSALSVFDGADPNGTWRLFVQDAHGPSDPGLFAGGWALEITTKVKGKKRR